MCRQLLVDLSDNPMFVNHTPENFDANTGTNRSNPGNMGNISPSNGHSSIPTVDKSSRKDSGGAKSIPDVVSRLNFQEKEVSKDSKKEKIWIGIGEGFG